MKVNFKLKLLFEDYIQSCNLENLFCIHCVSIEDKDGLFRYIQSLLKDDTYFVYTSSHNKYTSKLEVVRQLDIINYFDKNNIIYAIDTLDMIDITFYEDSPYNTKGYEICATGKFAEIIKKLSLEFQYDKSESNIPD
jgi:hypothetical protein